jgi:hypothetical protein
MIETVRKLISCKWCDQILKKPVLLPCGATICLAHEAHFRACEVKKEDEKSSLCQLCGQDHRLTEFEHLPTNEIAQDLLDSQLNELYFGKNYEKAAELLKTLHLLMSDYEQMKNNPEGFIFDYFQAVRDKVDLIRDELIQKVNECSANILTDIDSYESECRTHLSVMKAEKAAGDMPDIAKIKSELDAWQKRMDKLLYDKELYKTIAAKHKNFAQKLSSGIEDLQNEAIRGKARKFDFELKYLNIFDTFCKHIGFNT